MYKSNPRFKWNLVIVYGAAQNEGKIAFLTKLSHMLSWEQGTPISLVKEGAVLVEA